MQEREHIHAKQTTTSTHDEGSVPGHVSRSAALAAPEHPVASGLLLRKAERDDNGVAESAEHAVASAATSSGTALPAAIQRKFEGSLGADLSSVRVHTGGESQAAAQAVGAKAYTVGQDIHFGAGQFDPSNPSGEHLLAHEVAHTVQQQGGTSTRQNKLEVSSPGDSAEHEADHAADAMVAGRTAQVTTSAGVSRRAIQRIPTTEKAHPSPIRDASTALSALAIDYEALMEKQVLGLDNLFSDYQTKDDPTLEDKVIQTAVAAALAAATGLITGPLVAAAVEAVALRITAGAASKAIELGGQQLDQFLAAYTAKTTAYTAKVQGWISAGITAGVGRVMKPGALEPFRAFYEVQRDTLIDLKRDTRMKINNSIGEFAGPAGIEMAEGISVAVEAAFTRAIESQYMTSLSQWSKIAKGKISGSITLTVPSLWARGGQISFSSAQLAANDSIRNRLQQNPAIAQRKLSEFALPLTLKVTTPGTFMHPESTWTASGSTSGMPTSYPTSDSGAYDLYRFGTGQQYKDKNEVPFATGVTVGAAAAFAAIGELTWAQLPKLG